MPKGLTVKELIDATWFLSRDLVSDGFDHALEIMADQVPMTIHEYPTGEKCWTWTVPPKWTCDSGQLIQLSNSEIICDYKDNPLHVACYSDPMQQRLQRNDVLRMVDTHKLESAIPYRYKFYSEGGGLCASKRRLANLPQGEYEIAIDSRFEEGTLKVGEVVIPGKSDDCIVFCAHLDHPGQANDGLSGVAVGIEVMRQIAKRKGLRYTYRFVIVPETIGSIAFLSHNEDLIALMRGGLFLEMMGSENLLPTLQHSYQGDSQADLCFLAGLMEFNPAWQTRTGKFREIIENDERQFNAPGVRVPMLSLSRLHLPTDEKWPYPEYHTSLDTPDLISEKELAESVQIILKMVDVWEGNWYPEPKFSGEIFLSGYGLFADNIADPKANDRLTDVMFSLGDGASVADIAATTGYNFTDVLDIVMQFQKHGLVELYDQPDQRRLLSNFQAP